MIRIATLLALSLGLTPLTCLAQNPPCGLTYGTTADRENIQQMMFTGSVTDVENAINQAKETRGLLLGCAESSYGPFVPADVTVPLLSDVEQVWNSVYVPFIDGFQVDCPDIGRTRPAVGLGAYYAKMAGYYNDSTPLSHVANNLLATQYSQENAPLPLVASAGLYAYFNAPSAADPCALPGIAGSTTEQFCQVSPADCPTYTAGLFSGYSFAVTDHTMVGGAIVGDLGGAGFDHGWSTVFMIESAIEHLDPLTRQQYRASAVLAGEWAVSHPLSSNHNYTAKLTWLLAELYAWTGREDFKTALIDRLDRNLVPGVLMDQNNDGLVDGMTTLTAFADLTNVAKTPGRYWDGHNALPWYQSMNAWALLEAYVAFRDRGDTALANTYKPYVIATLDNLSNELVTYGVPTTAGPGSRDFPYAILLGIWKLAQYENEAHPLWEQAAWSIWNTGIFANLSEHGVNVPLYLLILNETPYTPLHERDPDFSLSIPHATAMQYHLEVYPNPSTSELNLEVRGASLENGQLYIYDNQGRLVLESTFAGSMQRINVQSYSQGLYWIRVETAEQTYTSKFVKE